MCAQGVEVSTRTYNSLLTVLSLNEQLDEAERVWAEMDASGAEKDLFSFSAMLSATVRARRPAEAEGYLEEMAAQGLEHNAFTLTAYLHASGIVRFATEPYTIADLGCRRAHLCNYAVNKRSERFVRSTVANASGVSGARRPLPTSAPSRPRA